MTDAKTLWAWWQALLLPFQEDFTRPGWVRFAQWVTGMVLCWEEHTITQILTALGLGVALAAFGVFCRIRRLRRCRRGTPHPAGD